MTSERIIASLALIDSAVATFGSALHAYDRGYQDAADRLDLEGNQMIATAFRNAPELQDLLPWLWSQCLRELPLQELGYQIRAELEAARRQLG